MENQPGKRVKSGGVSGGVIAAIVAVIVVALLAVAYLVLCAVSASGDKLLPGTTMGDVPVAGLTVQQAESTVEKEIAQRFQTQQVEFTCGGQTFTVPGSLVSADAAVAIQKAVEDQTGSFLSGGVRYLSSLFSATDYPLELSFAETPAAIAEAEEFVQNPVVETTWEVQKNTLIFHKGTSGQAIDAESLEEQFLEQFKTGIYKTIEVPVTVAQPAEPDFEAIYQEVYAAPQDARLDTSTKEIVSAVTGLSFDKAAAQAGLAATEEGGTYQLPLTETAPQISTANLKANLFKDVLGTSTTKCSGPSNRWYNISLAAGFVNDTILLPGETFSYNDVCGPYSGSKGYKKAGAYQAGKTVDTTAGGICQLSSTLYWTTLKANLEIVERSRHKYDVGYMPTGMDATVYSDTLDFKFKNDTDYPIQIEAYQDSGHKLHVTIRGTNVTGIYGDPYSVLLSTIPATTVYEADATRPVGSAPKKDPERTAYNGKKAEVYQVLKDKNGNEIKRFLLHSDTYSARNGVYFYNPADAARLGIDPATGKKTGPGTAASPSPSVTVAPSAVPTVSPSPSAAPPVVTTSPPPVVTTPTPEVTPPAVTSVPDPVQTPEPLPTPEPAPTVTPVPTETAPAA